MMSLLGSFTPLDTVLIAGIVWLSGMFVWLLRRFIRSYDENTKTLIAINATMQVMDKKLDTATTVDREILMELARIRSPLYQVGKLRPSEG